MPGRNASRENKKKREFRGEMSARTKKILQAAAVALLVFAVPASYLWKFFVIEANEQRFQNALRSSGEQHAAVVLAYVEQMQQSLAEASSAITRLQQERLQPDFDFLQEGTGLESLVDLSGNIISVALYQAKDFRQQSSGLENLSFIQVDKINQGLRETRVFPEAVEEKPGWVIYWTVGVRDAFTSADVSSDNGFAAALLVKTTLDTLLAVNQAAVNDLGQLRVELLQKVRLFGYKNFLSTDNTSGDLGEYVTELESGDWQLFIHGSAEFKQSVSLIPWWLLLGLLALLLLCVLPVLWLVKTLPEDHQDDIQGVQLPSRHVEPGEEPNGESQADQQVNEEGEEMADPLLLSSSTAEEDGLGGQPVTEAEAILTESFLVPANIFRSYDIRGLVGEELSPDLALLIGRAIASEALAAGEQSLVVGYDARVHSQEICERLIQGVQSTGCHVIEAGLVPTPLLNFATVFSEETNSGVVVTASHNPGQYNGFKIVIDGKSLHDEGIQRIKNRIEEGQMTSKPGESKRSATDFSEDYVDTVLADVAVASDMRVVVDAANGAASELAPRLLEELGCSVEPLFCEFDGRFPNHDPDPGRPENLQALIDKVAEENADLGVALDGDGDRLVVVTRAGKIVWPDQLMMIFVKDLVTRNPGCDVVYDVKSSRYLGQLISRCGGRPVMWKTGHSQIKNKMLETGALLGGEYSGHIFFKERWFGFDDGLYATARLLEILSLSDQTLDEMLATMPKNISTPEIKIDMGDDKKFGLVQRLVDQGEWESGEVTTIDGVRVDFAKGWGLVRASNTSAALTLRFEAADEGALIQLKQVFKRELRKVEASLDLSVL